MRTKIFSNITSMPHLPQMQWTFDDKLKEAILNAGGDKAYYVYDSAGNRTRKVVEKGIIREERFYFNNFEVYRKYSSNTLTIERTTAHIMDDKQRIATIDHETGGQTTVRYQVNNHLGSSSIELNESGVILTYEEYHPFGTTAYQKHNTNISQKRYKYVGKERDEETGLYYYGARYYGAWIGRFVSVDALQHKYPFFTPYQYTGNNPVTFTDIDGNETTENDTLSVKINGQEKESNSIHFISNRTGKFLGTFECVTLQSSSIRSINEADFKDLQENKFKPIDQFGISIEGSSKVLSVDNEKIISDIKSITTKKTITTKDGTEAIEQALFFVYDHEKNLLTTKLLPTSGKYNGKEFQNRYNIANHLNMYDRYGSSVYVSEGKEYKIIGEMHTHENTPLVYSSEVKIRLSDSDEGEKISGPGMSLKDLNFSRLHNIPIFAIAMFHSDNIRGNIYFTTKTEENFQEKIAISTVNKLIQNPNKFLQHVVQKNY